jgi:hypothetical protein
MVDEKRQEKTENYPYKPDDLITKVECMQLFCTEFRYSKSLYYKHHRKIIKFRPVGSFKGELERIPFKYAMGIINKIKGIKNPDIPYPEDLDDWIVQKPENVGG